jgi:hypothetical protein
MTIIAWLARLLGGRTWLAWLLTAASVAGALGGIYAYVDHQGYKRATIEWSQKYDRREAELQAMRFRELDRQATANAEAKAAESARLREMAERLADLEAAAAENDRAAEADPNADRIGLGADSVERLNRIR